MDHVLFSMLFTIASSFYAGLSCGVPGELTFMPQPALGVITACTGCHGVLQLSSLLPDILTVMPHSVLGSTFAVRVLWPWWETAIHQRMCENGCGYYGSC